MGDMPAELEPFLTRQMEVYAGYLSYADHHVGRLVDALEDLGVLNDTLVFYVIGDNGASTEGTVTGTFNEYVTTINLRADLETPEFLISRLDELGGPTSYNHYAAGWAHALDTPYQWAKQVASHWGGTRNATVVHWPRGIRARGELRHQFCHVIDVAPTVLEAAGLPEPTTVHGVAQEPLHGTSMVYPFDHAHAPERHQTQYFPAKAASTAPRRSPSPWTRRPTWAARRAPPWPATTPPGTARSAARSTGCGWRPAWTAMTT
jgi:arylsulfatase A-like enzyme